MKLRFFWAIAIFVGFPVLASACTCSTAPPGQCPGLQPSDVVFLGTVTDVEQVSSQGPPLSQQIAAGAENPADANSAAGPAAPPSTSSAWPITRYHFRIDERFAGPGDAEIDIFSGGDDADCGYKFTRGGQYLVYTSQGTDGHLYATICNGTRTAAEGLALIPQLRAMRDGRQVASVFGVLRRSDPPFLSPPDDPDDPVALTSLKLRSSLDRFQSNTDQNGVYSFYDVHEGEYNFTADLPEGTELTQKTIIGALPPFRIPDGACYEYNVNALPTGHIRGTVSGPDGKPLGIASLELFRKGTYDEKKPGYWGFQGMKGVFDFDHVGPGEYVLVYNRTNRKNPNSPFPRMFYPGVADIADAETIVLKEGERLQKIDMKLDSGFPVRNARVRLKWTGPMPDGSVTVAAKADHGENPAASHIDEAVYAFPLFPGTNYTISAWEDVTPGRAPGPRKKGQPPCYLPAKLQADPVTVSGSDADTAEITLTFPKPECADAPPDQPQSAAP
jgi:hypothetical protein